MQGPTESAAVAGFFESASVESSILLLEGEPGIGKTTLWLSVLHEARARGYHVLSARPTEAEAQLAYSCLADLLRSLDPNRVDRLPAAQVLAVNRVLSRAHADGSATEPTTTAAAFLSLVQALADETPVLLALDDLQWVDLSSVHAIASASRRLPLGASVVATVRTDHGDDAASWLEPPQPHAIRRVRLGPLPPGALETMVTERTGRALSRSAWDHVHKVSHGNPFFALELARSVEGDLHQPDHPLPATLAEVVRRRLGDVDPQTRRGLLAVAADADPTFELVQSALGISEEETRAMLEEAERRRLLEIDGHRLRFTHPLLANGVYTGADAPDRREMHRRLADDADDAEQRARHLALATVHADSETLAALEQGADAARARGAPAAAAELLQMALRLGGEDPELRLQLSQHLLNAGDAAQARHVLETSIRRVTPGPLRARMASALAQAHLDDDSFVVAADLLSSALADTQSDLELRIEILTRLAYALLNCGQPDDALRHIDQAVALGESSGIPRLFSLALGMSAMIRFLRGDGVEEEALTLAMELEDREAAVALAFRPTVHAALLRSWTGRLDEGQTQLNAVRRRCLELGDENSLMFLDFQAALIECWRGDLDSARRLEKEMGTRAQQLGGDLPLAVTRSVTALIAAHAGHVDVARRDAVEATERFKRCGMQSVSEWPVATLGFLEVSLGDHRAALDVLEPLVARVLAAPRATEIVMASFMPDAIESLVALGRLDEADVLVATLERNGQRLDRAWMLAMAHRGRSMMHSSRAELERAHAEAQHAMAEHDRLSMPFERARTQLVLGQIQRRTRQKEAAAATLAEAVAGFDRVGAPLWADRGRAEQRRIGTGKRAENLLTSSEQRVAELAANGLTNREVAATLFISPKTVESNLARVYRKLDIRSRAELGQRMGTLS